MKRDMDLARQILFAIEENEEDPIGWIKIDIPDRSQKEISYHVQILEEAGLIAARDLSTTSGFTWKPTRLTWQGHEFLDAARSDTLSPLWRNRDQILRTNHGILGRQRSEVA